jgi:hypothetical protein
MLELFREVSDVLDEYFGEEVIPGYCAAGVAHPNFRLIVRPDDTTIDSERVSSFSRSSPLHGV